MPTHRVQGNAPLNQGEGQREVLPLFPGWRGADVKAGSQPRGRPRTKLEGTRQAMRKTKPLDCPWFSTSRFSFRVVFQGCDIIPTPYVYNPCF